MELAETSGELQKLGKSKDFREYAIYAAQIESLERKILIPPFPGSNPGAPAKFLPINLLS
jgi:hypothetical protein